MKNSSIIIRKMVMHILDSSKTEPVFSETELTAGEELYEYVKTSIKKLRNSGDLKSATLDESTFLYKELSTFEEENFLSFSKTISSKLFDIMLNYINIPAADFLIVSYQENKTKYLALLKLNYKQGYTHFVDKENQTKIIKQTKLHPVTPSKLNEAVLINLETMKIELIEKAFVLKEDKEFYFAPLFLECTPEPSKKKKLKLLDKTIQKINKIYFDDNKEKQIEARSFIYECLTENNVLEVPKVIESLYGSVPDIQKEAETLLEKYHINGEKIVVSEESLTKQYSTQKITLENGIIIKVPTELINMLDMEITSDHSLSLSLKNIKIEDIQ